MEHLCPSCGKSVEAWSDLQFCPFCGSSLSIIAEPEQEVRYILWEDGTKVEFFRALWDTWIESVFHPTRFFSTMPVKGGYGKPLLYGCIVGEIAFLVTMFWEGVMLTMSPLEESYDFLGDVHLGMPLLVAMVILSPVLIIAGYFVAAAILHLCLFIVGGARRDFEATFRVVCYTAGPNLFNIVPLCGGLVAWVWSATLNIIGVRETHDISAGKALLAYSLPALICCGFLFAAFLLGFPYMKDLYESW